MVWTADEIRRANEVDGEELRNLNLVLSEDSDFEELTEAIAELVGVKRVVISCVDDDEPDWDLDVLEDLFMAVGSRPKLQTIKLKHLGYEEDNPFPISLLRDLLVGNHSSRSSSSSSSSSGVHTIQIQDSGLVNDDEGFREFSETLRVQGQLKRFKIESCSIANDPTDSSVAMTYVANALSSLPILKDVALEVEDEAGELGLLSDSALERLCKTRTLESLRLSGFELDDEGLVVMATALRTTTRLKKLCLELYGDISRGCSALADMIQVNSSLEFIRFDAAMDFNAPTFLSQVADALTDNTTIRDVKFYGFDAIGDVCELAFAKMMKTNDTLQTLILSGEHDERFTGVHRPTIDFYLRLNKRGRRRVTQDFESIGRDEWMMIFSDCAMDLDCLYFFLHMNPLLCSIPDDSMENASTKKTNGGKTTTTTASTKDELIRIRKVLEQFKVESVKSSEILLAQQAQLINMLKSNHEMVSALKNSYKQQMSEKDSKIQELAENVTNLRQQMALVERFVSKMEVNEVIPPTEHDNNAAGCVPVDCDDDHTTSDNATKQSGPTTNNT